MKKNISLGLLWILMMPCGICKSHPFYSQQAVESLALKTFLSNQREEKLATAHWDYVPGLVALSVLQAWQRYPEKTDYYDTVKAFADHALQGGDSVKTGVSNLDDLAAGKIFFILYETELRKGNTADAQRYKQCVTALRNRLKYHHQRIAAPLPGAGGFFHKQQYPNQMWLDGLYMGAPMYAGWQHYFGTEKGEADNWESWTDIASQFKTIHKYSYDAEKQLNYHVWSAAPDDINSFWAKKSEPHLGCSPEFWGRSMGWYFAALVDVLDWMPKTHPDYPALCEITREVAAGLARCQDAASGCWYQLLQYNETVGSTCNRFNYLESSASSMFTYAYFKGMRIGVLDKKQYKLIAEKAYQGLLQQFIRIDADGVMHIIQSCASAGLGPAKDPSRNGTIDYYLCGKDVVVTQDEGKAIGPFIMASLEYEKDS
ncbi:family 88 glycosyl hydrolase [Bacteroidia bacterium]|nr:family 88 glycosyl hydrolase [Bacteroidia bacterium]